MTLTLIEHSAMLVSIVVLSGIATDCYRRVTNPDAFDDGATVIVGILSGATAFSVATLYLISLALSHGV